MNRKKTLIISSVVILIVLGSFFIGTLYPGHDLLGVETPPTRMTTSEDVTYVQGAEPKTAPQERVVIYNAQVSLETTDIQGCLQKIRGLAEGYGGYVASSSRSSYGIQSRAEMGIRVPKDKFHAAIQQIEAYGKVLDESTTSEDVTQQYIDVKARLSNMLKQEERLREILAMATTVDEVLRVENELTRIRGEIDSLQGQINYLEGNAEMSLIQVLLTEPAPPFTPPGMDWGETLEIAIIGFFTVLRGMLILVVSVIPIAVVGVPLYHVYERRKRKQQGHKTDIEQGSKHVP